MSFTGTMQGFALPQCCWIKNAFEFKRLPDGRPVMNFEALKVLPESGRREFEEIAKFGGNAQLTNLYALNRLCTNGVFLLKMNDFDRFEETDLTIQVQDYSQPFPTVVIQLPKEYSVKKTCKDPYAGMITPMTGVRHDQTHRPDFVILSHDAENKIIIGVIYLTSKDIYSMILPENGQTMEVQLTTKLKEHTFQKSLTVTEEELETYAQVFRASLNACMLADFGITPPVPENPRYYQKLLKRGNKKLIALHPQVFDLLYKFENGGPRSPHWRRAHWRMQRHGPGLTLQKRIRIARTWIGGADDRTEQPAYCSSGSVNPDS